MSNGRTGLATTSPALAAVSNSRVPESSSPKNAGKTDRKSTRLNSSHLVISYAVFCLKKKKQYVYQSLPHPCFDSCISKRPQALALAPRDVLSASPTDERSYRAHLRILLEHQSDSRLL